MTSFWNKLEKPFFVLAPMDGVTDTVFRQIVKSVSSPDVLFTEFVAVDALLSTAQSKVIKKSLKFSEIERPIVAQIWGNDPQKFYESAKIISKLGFDGIDINMGCPEKSIVKRGCCSGLIKNPKLATEIILATIKGAGKIPVSVKTRIGFETIDIKNWVETLLKTPISALILHLRTTAEMSKVPAHWEEIEKAVKIRDELKSRALIVGNGDVKSLKEAKEKCRKYKIDGVMIGTGIFENIYIFNENIDPKRVTQKQKFELLLKHVKLFEKVFGDKKHFALMKKFVKCYINNFDGASEKREVLMKTKSLSELIDSITLFKTH